MNHHEVKGNLRQLKGQIKEHWGKLTDDDVAELDGRREQLVGKIQERYGEGREAAEKQIDRFFEHVAKG